MEKPLLADRFIRAQNDELARTEADSVLEAIGNAKFSVLKTRCNFREEHVSFSEVSITTHNLRQFLCLFWLWIFDGNAEILHREKRNESISGHS